MKKTPADIIGPSRLDLRVSIDENPKINIGSSKWWIGFEEVERQ